MLSPALSKHILDVHPWSDSTEFRGLAKAVPIALSYCAPIAVLLFSTLCPSSFAIILMEKRDSWLLYFNCLPDVL